MRGTLSLPNLLVRLSEHSGFFEEIEVQKTGTWSMPLRHVSDLSKSLCYVHGVRGRKVNKQTWHKKRQSSGVRSSRAGGGGLQMLHSSEADNVLPRLPQGPRLQWSVLIWVSSKLVLQGSAVLTVILLVSAVSHLLVTSCGNIDTLKITVWTDMIFCAVPAVQCQTHLQAW